MNSLIKAAVAYQNSLLLLVKTYQELVHILTCKDIDSDLLEVKKKQIEEYGADMLVDQYEFNTLVESYEVLNK